MSQLFTYGFFGEDEAQRNFLEKYLHQEYPKTFLEDEEFRWRIKARNRDQVDALLPQALFQRAKMSLDVLFVGRDIDTYQTPGIIKKQVEYAQCCQGHPAVLMLPVQCIEYWLWYLKRRQEEPGRNTPLESQTRTTAKQAVYADTKVVAKQIGLANDILRNFDVAWLESRSESFKHFHQQVCTFIQKYNKPQP